MKLKDYMSTDNIIINEDFADKPTLLARMVSAVTRNSFLKNNPLTTEDAVLKAIIEREKLSATGLGDGLGFPHARMKGIERIGISIAILNPAIEYGADDNQPVDVACMVISPESTPTVALKILAQLTPFLVSKENRAILKKCQSQQEVLSIIGECRVAIELPVYASDIMRAPRVSINLDTPLKSVTKQMHALGLDAVSVLGPNGHLKGEITSDLLFRLGIPDFFRQLKSISFVRKFDPFEQYFSKEAEATAGDVMSTEFAVAKESDTLMEVVFLLAVKAHNKVYVVDEDGIRIGVIDRHTVLDRVINL